MYETPFSIELSKFSDDRGEFTRLFCQETLYRQFDIEIKQVNCSVTSFKGTVRGMHYQRSPFEEVKFVTCTRGEIQDACIDMREGSSDFGKIFYCNLKQSDSRVFVVPKGFAHGFQTLSDDTEVIYSNTATYAKEYELNVSPLSPEIKWPLKVINLSQKDASSPLLSSFL